MSGLVDLGNAGIWQLSMRERRHALKDLKMAVEKFARRCDEKSAESLRYELEELACHMTDVQDFKKQLQEHFHKQEYYRNTDLFQIVRDRMKESKALKE